MRILILLSFVFAGGISHANTPDKIMNKIDRLQRRINNEAYDLNQNQLRRISRKLRQIKRILDNDLSEDDSTGGDSTGDQNRCADKTNSDYESAYKWAFSSEGLNYSRSSARSFATKVQSKCHPGVYLRNFSTAYTWAFSDNGLNYSRGSARTFAEKIAERDDAAQKLSCFRESYDFAFSSTGLNLSRGSAVSHANSQCDL